MHSHCGFHSGFAPTPDAQRWVQLDFGAEYPIDSVIFVPASLGDGHAFAFPTAYTVESASDPGFEFSGQQIATVRDDRDTSPLPRWIPGGGRKARYLRITINGLVPQPRLGSRFIFCLGEVLVFSGGRNVALGSAVTAKSHVDSPPTWAARHLVDGIYSLGIPSTPAPKTTNGWHSAIFNKAQTQCWVQVDLGAIQPVEKIRILPAHPPDFPDRPGFGFPRRFKIETGASKDFSDAVSLADYSNSDFPTPGDVPLIFDAGNVTARYVRLTASQLWERTGDYVFALGELQVMSRGVNVASGAPVEASASTVTTSWRPEFLVDGKGGAGDLVDEEQWLRKLSDRRQLMRERENLEAVRDSLLQVMHNRIWAVGLLTMAATLSLTVAYIWKSRRSRRAEMEALRSRVARDLHDEIGSNLSSIRLMSEMACRNGIDPCEAAQVLEDIKSAAVESTEALRDIVRFFREGEFPRKQVLIDRMRRCAEALLGGIEWTMESTGDMDDSVVAFTDAREVLLILREALHNCARHSGARSVQIHAAWQGSQFELVIHDDGRGFSANHEAGAGGIRNMKERAAILGGTLEVRSAPGAGTVIHLKAALK